MMAMIIILSALTLIEVVEKSTTLAATKNSPMLAMIPQIPAMVKRQESKSQQQASNKIMVAINPATQANHHPATEINKAMTANI